MLASESHIEHLFGLAHQFEEAPDGDAAAGLSDLFINPVVRSYQSPHVRPAYLNRDADSAGRLSLANDLGPVISDDGCASTGPSAEQEPTFQDSAALVSFR